MFHFLRTINDWIDRKLEGDDFVSENVLRIRFDPNAKQRIDKVVSQSAHPDIVALTAEAYKVSETIYQHGSLGRTVYCTVVDGKIVMTIDDPDGGDGLPVDDDDVVVQLFPKAA